MPSSAIGFFSIGESAIGQTIVPPGTFPPAGPTSLTTIIKSYLYQQYNDDADLQAYINAVNALGQGYLDSMNELNLAVYTSDQIAGPLLDWIGDGIYGIKRPTLPGSNPVFYGAYGTVSYAQYGFPYAGVVESGSTDFYTATDDVYKRIMTWQLYKGDGFVFSIPWLKRRVVRFLDGVNGVDPGVSTTYDIGVSIDSGANGVITIYNADPTFGPIFKAAVDGLAINLPFQISWSVTLS